MLPLLGLHREVGFGRDFTALASAMKGLHGEALPTSWAEIGKSRSVTGASR